MNAESVSFFQDLITEKSSTFHKKHVISNTGDSVFHGGCRMIPSDKDNAQCDKSNDQLGYSSWQSLGFSQSILDAIYSRGILFPSPFHVAVSSFFRDKRSAHFVLDKKQCTFASLYAPWVLQHMNTELAQISVIVHSDASKAAVNFQFFMTLIPHLSNKIECAVMTSNKDLSEMIGKTTPIILLTTQELLKELLSRLHERNSTTGIRHIITDQLNEAQEEQAVHDIDEVASIKLQNTQLIYFASSDNTRAHFESRAIQKIVITADAVPYDTFIHECVRIESSKTKLAMLLATVKNEKNTNIIILTKHASAVHRIKLLLTISGRNAVVLDNSMNSESILNVHNSIKSGESDTVILKDISLFVGKTHYPTGPVTVIHYDTAGSVSDFVEKTSLFDASKSQVKVVSFISESEVKMLYGLRLLLLSDGVHHYPVPTVLRNFDEQVLTDAQGFIEDHIHKIRKELALEKILNLHKKDNIDKDLKEKQSNVTNYVQEKKPVQKEKNFHKESRKKTRKHERNSYHEKLTRNRLLIKKARGVHDLKGLLPKGKFRKLRKRQERIDRQKNPLKKRTNSSKNKRASKRPRR